MPCFAAALLAVVARANQRPSCLNVPCLDLSLCAVVACRFDGLGRPLSCLLPVMNGPAVRRGQFKKQKAGPFGAAASQGPLWRRGWMWLPIFCPCGRQLPPAAGLAPAAGFPIHRTSPPHPAGFLFYAERPLRRPQQPCFITTRNGSMPHSGSKPPARLVVRTARADWRVTRPVRKTWMNPGVPPCPVIGMSPNGLRRPCDRAACPSV